MTDLTITKTTEEASLYTVAVKRDFVAQPSLVGRDWRAKNFKQAANPGAVKLWENEIAWAAYRKAL